MTPRRAPGSLPDRATDDPAESRAGGWRSSAVDVVRSARFRIVAAILVLAALGLAAAGASAFLLSRERVLAAVDEELALRLESVRAVVRGDQRAAATDPTATDPTDLGAAPGTPGPTTSDPAVADPVSPDPLAPDQAVPPVFSDIDAVMYEVVQRVLPDTFESTIGFVESDPRFVPGIEQGFDLTDDPAFLDRVIDMTADGGVALGTSASPLGTLRYLAVPVRLEGVPGQGVYLTAVRLESELAGLDAVFRTFTVVAVGALLITGVAGWYVAGRLLHPIRQLRTTASRISASNFHERIPVTGTDDVSELTRTVNDMIARLEASFSGQIRLLDDVRHELRTPITIVQGHLELLDARDPDEVRAVQALALDELDRMTQLVDAIAAQVQAEQGGAPDHRPTDVDELTRQVLLKAQGIADRDWRLERTADVVVDLDAGRITQAWLQLAENAAKYSDADTPIVIGSAIAGAHLELWVTDSGGGVPEEARERIFERFGRVDTGRGVAGSGLGLSIVRAIATSHGGRVKLDSVIGRGSRFTIVIPAGSGRAVPGAPDDASAPSTALAPDISAATTRSLG